MINAVSSIPQSSPQDMGSQSNPGAFPPPPPSRNSSKPDSNAASNSSPRRNRSKKSMSPKMILGGLMLLLLVVGGAAGFLLMNQNQDTRNQASVINPYTTCSTNADCPSGEICVALQCVEPEDPTYPTPTIDPSVSNPCEQPICRMWKKSS